MIIAERKPIKELLDMLAGHDQVLLVGCKGCVMVCNAGGVKEVGALATVMPLRSAREARAIHKNKKRRGVEVFRDVMTRLEGVPEQAQAQEGLKICIEQMMQALKEMKGVQGVHIMSAGWEEAIPELVKESGLQRPQAKG